MGKKRQVQSIIGSLPPELRETVDEMIKANVRYSEIADYIRSSGHGISYSSVQRYAARLHETVEGVRLAQENLRVVMEETRKYPQLDTAEGIIRLLSCQMLNAAQQIPEDYLKSLPPEQFLKQCTGIIRAAAYKQNIDLKNKGILEAGYEQVKVAVFEAMARERPELYREVSAFLEERKEGGGE